MTARTPERNGTPSPAGAEPPADDRPAGSRAVRRRLTFGVSADLADLPAALSPWQRAYEAWRAAGIRWGHGAPPRERAAAPERAAPASRNAIRADAPPAAARPAEKPEPAKAEPAKPEPAKAKDAKAPAAKTGDPKAKGTKPKKAKGAKARSAGSVVAAATAPAAAPVKTGTAEAPDPKDEPPAPTAEPQPTADESAPNRGTRRLRVAIAGAAGLVVVAGGAMFVLDQGGGGAKKPRPPAAVPAAALFGTDPAATTDGLVQDLAVVTASGRKVVAAGTEGDGTPGRERARFLVSADGGHAWKAAKVRGADGSEPPAGERPRLVAAGAGKWAALGQSPAGTVVWLSGGGMTWTRHLDTSAFKPGDQVNALVATVHGFVAVGSAGGRAVVWSTADGRAWQRVDGLQAGITGLDRVAASGGVLVTHGTFSRKVTRKKGRKTVTRTVRGDGLWRSADGGRTWTAVAVPQAQGSQGATIGLVAGPGGFATVREGRRTTGRKKHRRTTRFGVLFTSPDGQKWQAAGRISVPGYGGVERFGGSQAGFGVLVKGAKGRRTVLRSADGRTWQPSGTVAEPVRSSGLAVADGGAVTVAGRQGDDAYLSGANLAAVPGAVHTELAIRSLAAGPGRAVAVGSTNGGAAVWSSPDGRGWTRGRVPAAAGRLSDVAFGGQGWLAVGRADGARPGALAMTSKDGTVWARATVPAGPLAAVASGSAGYVAVGGGAVWRSPDLRTWKRAAVAGGNLVDVASTGSGYVAVGGRGGKPAVWTSPDGAKWTPTAAVPPGGGPLTQVAARGNALVAAGAGASLMVSPDAGRTWARRTPPGARQATAVTATPKGFVAAVTTAPGGAAVFGSPDGSAWARVPARGLGGRAERRLTAMTPAGAAVLATGTGVRDGAETPLLWRAPVPAAGAVRGAKS
ncbi:hypothetical protein amrb99_08420 [Actinomadura sp. RB99]|uniref:sialidase family protein n=1 Tax=Actinomadura sp. RB99 TaxID=2691577 RepID=UPI001684FA42|nr:hypothetical protein [Actinomadura sp. RB99]MBD2891934.1 hypothetical protein [Actinomadura sp. RB99]